MGTIIKLEQVLPRIECGKFNYLTVTRGSKSRDHLCHDGEKEALCGVGKRLKLGEAVIPSAFDGDLTSWFLNNFDAVCVSCLRVLTEAPHVSIQTDGTTVWVNNDRCCIGRFGKMGIDVHTDIGADFQTGQSECLHCTHAQTTLADWKTFQSDMLKFHGVKVPDKYTPDRFKLVAA